MSTTTRPGIRAARAGSGRGSAASSRTKGSARTRQPVRPPRALTAPGEAGRRRRTPSATHAPPHRHGVPREAERRPSSPSPSPSPHAAAPADRQGGPAAAVAPVARDRGPAARSSAASGWSGSSSSWPCCSSSPASSTSRSCTPGPTEQPHAGSPPSRSRCLPCAAGSTPATGRPWPCRCRRTTSWPTTSRSRIPCRPRSRLSPMLHVPATTLGDRAAAAVGLRRPGPPAAPVGRPDDRRGRHPRDHAARRLQAARAQREPGRARRRVHQRSRPGRGRPGVRAATTSWPARPARRRSWSRPPGWRCRSRR